MTVAHTYNKLHWRFFKTFYETMMLFMFFLLVPFLADAQNIQSLVDAQYKAYASAHPWLGIAVVPHLPATVSRLFSVLMVTLVLDATI